MFQNSYAKQIATAIQAGSPAIAPAINQAFDNSIVGCTSEVAFLRSLIREATQALGGLSIPGVSITSQFAEIHQKPIVTYDSNKRCELGDLLVVIKYIGSDGSFEAKSIIYQIKLAGSGTTKCHIDRKQLDLLCDWPSFSFGTAAPGGPRTYTVTPTTLEFGSFMLEQRNPPSGGYLTWRPHCYGVCPHAMLTRSLGPGTVDIGRPFYARGDAHNLFSHLAFEIGEHHSNQQVKDLVEALYRCVGLSPDPPAEFGDYLIESEDDSFAVLEVRLEQK